MPPRENLKPKICAVITSENAVAASADILDAADLIELRIDLVGKNWRSIAKSLKKPWIATNRTINEGGSWQGSEEDRVKELLLALELKASIIDIELSTLNLEKITPLIKKKAKCLISYHNFTETPPYEELKSIVKKQISAGADICKVVTKANTFEDNATVLKLIKEAQNQEITAFAMGDKGLASRILCALTGGAFTYTSIEDGAESAPGQITVKQLKSLYEVMDV